MRSPPSLPATVLRTLAAVRRRRRALAVIQALCWIGAGVAIAAVALPLAGLPEEAPGTWARWALRLGLAAAVAIPVARYVVPPWRRTADPLRVARAVDDRVPATRDALHVAVDLAGALDAGRFDDPTTRHLARDHLAVAGDRVKVVDPRALLPVSMLGRRTLVGPGLLIVALAVVGAFPTESQRGLNRLLGPAPAGDAAADGADEAEDLEPVTLVLRNLVLELTPPAYSGREALVLDGTTGDFQALPGTRVVLKADVPESAESAAVTWYSPHGDEPAVIEGRARGGEVEIAFTVPGDGRYRVEAGRGRLREPLRTRRFRVEALPDDPPELEVSAPGAGRIEVTPDASVRLGIVATDDFALSRLELVVLRGRREVSRTPIADVVGMPSYEQVWGWSPASLAGKGGELELVVEAWDNDTVNGPKVTKSSAVDVWVPTPRDHHHKVLALKRRLLDQTLDLLAALLVSNVDYPADLARDAFVEQHDHQKELAAGVFATAAELATAMERDELENRATFLGLGTAVENLGRSWEQVVEVVETQVRPSRHTALDRSTLRLLLTARGGAIDELERIVLDLSAFIDLQIGEEVADELAGLEPSLAELADAIRENAEGGIDDGRVEELLDQLQQQLAELAAKMAQRSRGPDDGFANRMPPELQRDVLDEIRQLLAEGKHDEAMELLREMMDELGEMQDTLQSESEAMAGGQDAEQLGAQMEAAIAEAKRLEAEQREAIAQTRELQRRFGTGEPLSEEQRQQLAADIEELQRRAAAIPPRNLSGRTQGRMGAWSRLAENTAERTGEAFAEGDLRTAEAQARETGELLEAAREELDAASGEDAAAAAAAREEVAEAMALAADVERRLAQAESRAQRAQGQAADASGPAREQQAEVADGTGRLRQQVEQMGGSAFNPVSGRENLENAQQMMERAGGRLAQGRTNPALGSQQDALRQLQEFREGLEQAQQAMGQGSQRMGSGQGMAQGREQGAWERLNDWHDGDSIDPQEVEMSDPDDFVTPEAFRALVQEEAAGDAPERYKPMNNSYYEELIK